MFLSIIHYLGPYGLSIAKFCCGIYATYKAKTTYPDTIELDLRTLLSVPRSIRVAVIDDHEFPYTDALRSRGCTVDVFPDYTKPITQRQQRIRPINFSKYDIIVCDIHGIGSQVFPGTELGGLQVLEDLRQKHPLHVIVAYTGRPGAIYTKLKSQETIDGVLAKEWLIDDFLHNFQALLDIFSKPKERWRFVRRRLVHLEVSETKINVVLRSFVEQVLMCQYLSTTWELSAADTKKLVTSADRQLPIGAIAKGSVKVSEVASVISPYLLGAE